MPPPTTMGGYCGEGATQYARCPHMPLQNWLKFRISLVYDSKVPHMPLQNWLKFRVRGVCMLLESILEVSVRLCIVFIYLMLFECRGIIQCTLVQKLRVIHSMFQPNHFRLMGHVQDKGHNFKLCQVIIKNRPVHAMYRKVQFQHSYIFGPCGAMVDGIAHCSDTRTSTRCRPSAHYTVELARQLMI